MKKTTTLKSVLLVTAIMLLYTQELSAQWGTLGDRIADGLSNKAQQKIESEINSAADKTYDKTKQKTKESVKNSGNNSSSKSANANSSSSNSKNDDNGNSNGSSSSKNTSSTSGTSSNSSLKAYGKFDFIPGEKVIAVEDFAQDAVGDFPAKWNTNGGGEVVTMDGQQGKWLKFSEQSIIYPEFVNGLPDNFTLEFNLAANDNFSYYATFFNIIIAKLGAVQKEYPKWKQYGQKSNGMEFGVHPQAAGGKGTAGMKYYRVYGAGSNEELISNDAEQQVFTVFKNVVKVSIWRQKTRLRVYVNEEKIWDVPKAFDPAIKYNFIGFRTDGLDYESQYYLSNIRLAVGAPDTRHKFLELGKYSTTGIKFDVNSDKIKGESYGTLKDFADVLKENPEVKVKIVGHTDSDGDDASNMALSKKRAESVKATLNKEFGIDNSRMETEGKGETQPAEPNTSAEGKANNRRVEFIKL
jgi:outer membrane protein OmpA-like peptidoglycan-associated protein